MPEYIEREALLNELKEERKKGNFVFTTKWIKEIMDNLPAADVVEVVRCKDCVWWYPREYGSVIGRCENPYNGLANEYIEEDDFCSYGKKGKKVQRNER